MNNLYIMQFDYDVIFGQSYRLIPRPFTLVTTNFQQARERLVASTNALIQRQR